MSSPSRQPTPAQESRRAARELAVQGLYQWQMTGKSVTAVEAEFRSQIAEHFRSVPSSDFRPKEVPFGVSCGNSFTIEVEIYANLREKARRVGSKMKQCILD